MSDTPDTPATPEPTPEPDRPDTPDATDTSQATWQEERHEQSYPNAADPPAAPEDTDE